MVQVRQVIAGTPPVTGISSLVNLTDVNDSASADGAILVYNNSTGKHEYLTFSEDFTVDRNAASILHTPSALDVATLQVSDSAEITNRLTVAGFTYPTSTAGIQNGMAMVTDASGNLTFQFAGTEEGIVVSRMQDLTDVIANLNSSRNDRDILIFDSATGLYGTTDFDDGVRSNISVADSDASGFGTLAYDTATGIITFTKVTNANIRSAFSATGDLTYNESSGVFSFDVESVYTKDNFDSDLGLANTGQLPEGSNLYYTDARVDTYINASILTTDISEGTNLYYTTNRHDSDFDTRLASRTTSNLTEGSNLYYTDARANTAFDNRLATKSTTNLSEGTNLYYTLARADSAIDVKITQAYVKATGLNFDDVTDNNAVTTNAVTVGNLTSTGLTTTGGTVTHGVTATDITSASSTLIDTVAGNSTYTSIEYLIQLNNDSATETQISKITAAFDKTTVNISEYAVVHSGDSDLGTFTADVNSGNVRLFFQRRPSNNIAVKTTKTIIQ